MALTTYDTIQTSEIDPESPLTASLTVKWRDNPIALHQDKPGTTKPSRWCEFPPLLTNHGSEGDGTVTIAASATEEKRVYECVNFTLNSGQTLTVKHGGLVIRATDTITINGIIDATGLSRSTAGGEVAHNEYVISGSGAGGGGGGADPGGTVGLPGLNMYQFPGGAGGVNTGNGNGGSISNYTADELDDLLRLLSNTSLMVPGAPGGQGGSNGTAGAGAAADYGGASVTLIAPDVIVSSAGQILTTGKTGGTGGDNGPDEGGGGGGSGAGMILLVAQTLSMSGILSSTGGAGGVGPDNAGEGGNGGRGAKYQISLDPFTVVAS